LLAFRGCKEIGFVALFARDGTVLLTASEEPGLKLWDSETGESLGELNTDQASIRTMAISAGGHCVASGNYQTFAWDLQDGTRLWKHRGNFVRCLRVSQDGEFVAMGTAAQRVMLMNIRTGEVVESLEGHADDIDGLAFHPGGGLLASADRAGVIRLWRLDVDEADTKSVEGLTMLDQSDIPWPRCFRAHSDRAWSLDFSPDGDRLLSCSKDGTVKVWARRPPQMERPRETGDLVDLVFTRSGEEVLVCETNRIRLWTRGTGQQDIFGTGIAAEMSSVAISPDGRTVACGDLHGQVYLWDRVQGKVVRTVSMHDDHVDRIRFGPDGGMMLTSSWDGTAKLWRVDSCEELATFRLPPHCEDAAFSPDGKLLAISSQNDATIYEVSSRKAVHVLRGHQNTADCLAFSPDGRQLVTGSHDRTIRLWDVESGETIRVIPAHRNKISAIAISPDGRTSASGDKAGILAFSHVETGRFLFDVKLADQAIRALMFSPDGKALAVAATEKVLMLQINETSTGGAAQASERRFSNSDLSSKRDADGLQSR
jgi:WD40 repeat protein